MVLAFMNNITDIIAMGALGVIGYHIGVFRERRRNNSKT